MYEPEDDYMQEDEETEEIPSEMWQESAWITISAFFEEKGRPPIFKRERKLAHASRSYQCLFVCCLTFVELVLFVTLFNCLSPILIVCHPFLLFFTHFNQVLKK